jgi:hypothetical protein
MTSSSLRSKWQDSQRVVPITIAVVVLFFGSVVADELLLWKGVEAAETFLNDIAIAGLGGLTVWALLTVQSRRLEMLRARERMQMTIALNQQVRGAFSVMANSVLLENESDRLHGMDQATHQLDRILGDLAASESESGNRAANSRLAAKPSFPVSLQPNATRQN